MTCSSMLAHEGSGITLTPLHEHGAVGQVAQKDRHGAFINNHDALVLYGYEVDKRRIQLLLNIRPYTDTNG